MLHVFADRYGILKMKSETLNALFKHLIRSQICMINTYSIRYAYDNLPDGSALLTFLVHVHCYQNDEFWVHTMWDKYPSPFLMSVVRRLAQGVHDDLDVLDNLELCDYHEHKNEDERKACPHKYVVMDFSKVC